MEKIKINFPDGSQKEFDKGVTSYQIAQSISSRLADDALVADVDGIERDLNFPIQKDSVVKLYTFNDERGKHTYWHSTSHLMAHAIQSIYPEAKFGVGPAIDSGFYYDVDIDSRLTDDDLRKIEDKMLELTKQDNPFSRKELSKVEAQNFFTGKGDNYKLEIISELDESAEVISIYDEGSFTDLCTGPHLPSTGKIKYFKLLSVSGSYWRGDEKNKQLQRIYGISFPKKKMLDDYLIFLEEAKKRDHRKLGKELDLFSLHEEAGAGLVYWHPKGARIRLDIENFWRQAHLENGYEILYTPHMGKSWLWETSGHLGFYKENMYSPMSIDEQDYFIKPMNCPFHILVYKSHLRSYKDLPLRWAELGTVYRYEKSGVLHGLLRVRGFTQDDAHIFCAQEQIESEIIEVIRFCMYIWRSFGFNEMNFYVSTRPEKVTDNDDLWEKATDSLKTALEKEGLKYKIDEGGGAFYGPKIDIKIKDALNREWQMSTIQFDFNLPERFDMKYIGEDGKEHRPFMVHRALLGSLERFMGVLIEHYGGSFPLWLAPVQVAVLPISQNYFDAAKKVVDDLKKSQIKVTFDERNEKIGYKIRDWETKKTPYMLVIGEKEAASNSVSVRQHKKGDIGTMSVEEFKSKILEDIKNKIDHN
ncbi:MAG: threonine--tRNA ligase [Ignavibacteriales bacterium]|nr:MAG: threonine--tRNA ligase [Ignavibacteriales bacterium]